MREFIKRFSSLVKGTLSGFDRIVFKGLILPLMSSGEVMSFCRSRGILNKDYKQWMMKQTAGLIENAERYSKDNCGHRVEHLSSWRIRKEDLAHKRQITRVSKFNDGLRIRHWTDKNSVKLYNEQNVLRIETTINDPGKFKVFRHKQGQSPDEPKQRLPLRKGVMDIPLRATISQNINNRFSDDLATLHDKLPAGKYIEGINHHVIRKGRRFRALDPTGKDLELLRAISDPAYRVSGLTNKMLRQSLANTSFGTGRTDKQLSGKISRHLRLLRTHGLIRKIPRQNRYQVTLKGVRLLNILNAFWAASTEDLLKMAA